MASRRAQGTGAVNSQGLDFYERLVDALLERGIAPCVTLYHWDLPDALEAKGGWLQRSTAEAFAEYSAIVAARLGDRVAMWLTHNEPWCQVFLGYELGLFAPGRRDLGEAILCAHHLLLSHGLAVQALRSRVHAPIGIALNFMPAHPASRAPADLAAAARQDAYFNGAATKADEVILDGRVHDASRVEFLRQHFEQVPRARARGPGAGLLRVVTPG